MFKPKETEPTKLDVEIKRLFEILAKKEPEDEEYAAVADQVVKLMKLKELEAPRRVSADTLALIGANLAGIVLILSHERANVITTRAIGFISKLK